MGDICVAICIAPFIVFLVVLLVIKQAFDLSPFNSYELDIIFLASLPFAVYYARALYRMGVRRGWWGLRTPHR